MALLSLGLDKIPAPPRAAVVRPDLAEYGAAGTPIFGGFVRERGEYNPDLEGLAAIDTYEKMRRGDSMVAATLLGMKLPIRSAKWAVVAPEDATPEETAAADFVRECLFDRIDFEGVLRNALLMLDFGVAVHEDVWVIDGNRVRLKKCAGRLPITFYRWITDQTGDELIALEQMGYRGQRLRHGADAGG